jgi:hypothetical protein
LDDGNDSETRNFNMTSRYPTPPSGKCEQWIEWIETQRDIIMNPCGPLQNIPNVAPEGLFVSNG